MPIGRGSARGERVTDFTATGGMTTRWFDAAQPPRIVSLDTTIVDYPIYPQRMSAEFVRVDRDTIIPIPPYGGAIPTQRPRHHSTSRSVVDALSLSEQSKSALTATCGRAAYNALCSENQGPMIVTTGWGPMPLSYSAELPHHVVVVYRDGEMFRHILTNAASR